MDDPYDNFIPPPEAPVFVPNEEEFADPMAYIAKIRPVAEKSGICKIKPPPDWQPPFAVNVETFRFTPRIQRLNELEAKTRIKLNFLDQLAKFWDLQGCTLRLPHVERKLLDLYSLYRLVEEEGGHEHVVRERKWNKLATKLGFPNGKGIGGILKSHYERILYPYHVFRNGDPYEEQIEKYKKEEKVVNVIKEEVSDKKDKDYKPHGIAAKTAAGGYSRKCKQQRVKEEPLIDYSVNSELKKLQFYGAGPKAAVPSVSVKDEPDEMTDLKSGRVDFYHCHMCGGGDGEEYMLLCDGCDDAFHTYCLIPPLSEVPKGDWRCPKCVKQACSRPSDPYGFEQSKKDYNLQQFGEMADQFKSNYFNMPVHMVTCEKVEKEFWRLVNSIEEDVTVQYGADIHSLLMGSGFPVKQDKEQYQEDERRRLLAQDEDEEYLNSGWNLNNLPVLEQSILGHINGDISGMKAPWCYVGMCFSSFCWHIEDHWSYSINYMHWGEPKTWYGVPSTGADPLEEAMKKTAPELFDRSPDLLHHITTIMNPQILMDFGVPIVRTDQHAGEFIITFPRAYHAGFNQGYNFAEAVNFCPADWLPMGRLCIENYRSLHRQCVFSHEELICKMAADPDSLDLQVATVTYQDMLVIVEREKDLRKTLLERGTTKAEREAFELLPDDERQCDFCNTTCFLSGVTCNCTQNKMVCLHHMDKLCSCPPNKHCLRYRYTLDELPSMMHKLKNRAESFDNWNKAVKKALDATGDDKFDIQDFKNLITEAEDKHFPETELLQTLITAVGEAEKCANVANQLVSKKVRTRNRQSFDGKYIAKLSLEELNCFYEQVSELPCIISEGQLIKDLLDKVIDFQADAQEALEAETPDSEKLEQLINCGVTLDVDLPEIPRLKQVLLQARWLDEVRNTLQDPPTVSLDIMRKLMESGVSLAPHPAVEKAMAELQDLLTVSERWEEKARICLQARPRHVMPTLEAIINEAKGIPAYLPNVCALKEALRKAKEWTSKVEVIQNSDSYPYLDVLENIVNKGRPIPVRLDQLPQVESQVAAAKSWRERTARTFLKKNSTFSLLEILSPRADIGVYSSNKNKKKKVKEGEREKKDGESNSTTELKVEEHRDPATIVAAFKVAEQKEVESMCQLRTHNLEKLHQDDGEVKYCICRKGASGFMLQCELCKDWFHGSCVPLPKSANLKTKTQQVAAMQAARDLKFMCPLCLRSRRPRLETILSLLVSLQKLPVRLPEGEALQCLTERAMSWQDRARQALTTTELASALAKLSLMSQKMVEQAAREKTEKIINAELIKAANNPELQGHLASVTQSAFGGGQTSIQKIDSGTYSMDSDNSLPFPLSPQSSQNSDDIQMEVEVVSSNNNHTGMSEHAYSSASKANINMYADASPRKHPRKTPLVPRQLETPMLELSEMAKIQLEQLMMEGDLLEVSLDETQHIWRILQACQPRSDDKFLEFEDNDLTFPKDKIDKDRILKEKVKKEKDKTKEGEKKKKRKKEEDALLDVSKPKKNKEEVFITQDGKMILKIPKKKFKPKDKDGIKLKKEDKERDNREKAMKEVERLKVPGEEKVKKSGGDKSDKMKKKNIRSRVNKENGKLLKKRKPKNRTHMMDDDEDGDEDDCAAIKCLKPIGDEVNWVQCDRCEEWFHLLCVGLGDDEITEDEEYECFRCKQGVQSLFNDQSVSYNDKLSATESFVKQIRLSTPEKTLTPSTGVEVQTENFSTDDSLEMPSAMATNETDANQKTFDSPTVTPVNANDNYGHKCDNSDVTMETQTKDTDSEPESEKEEEDEDEIEKDEDEIEKDEDEIEKDDDEMERDEGLEDEAIDSDHNLELTAENISKSPVGVAS